MTNAPALENCAAFATELRLSLDKVAKIAE
jgi:hypothetical protein